MIQKLEKIDLVDKRVFIRVDFNVPISDGKISETHRIDSTLPTLRFVLEKARNVLIASHLGRPQGKKDPKYSLAPIRPYLEQILGKPVTLAQDCIGEDVESLVRGPHHHRVILLENLRFHKQEEENDPTFAQALASLAEVYVNDAFGTAHRAHASTAGMVKFFQQKGAGFLLQRELDYLGRILSEPEHPFIAILGGAKVSDKIGVLKNLLPKVDGLIIGGGMAYTFLKAQGIGIGKSLTEEERIPLASEILKLAKHQNVPVLLPEDHVVAETPKSVQKSSVVEGIIPSGLMGLDIGPKTTKRFMTAISGSRMVLWNGPLGLCEEKPFHQGTEAIAHALAESESIVIVAGGDTVAAITEAGVERKITHLSTGGGATLEFLEGKNLPGIEALEK